MALRTALRYGEGNVEGRGLKSGVWSPQTCQTCMYSVRPACQLSPSSNLSVWVKAEMQGLLIQFADLVN